MPRRDDPTLWFNLPGVLAAWQSAMAPNSAMARYNQANGGTNLYRAADGVAPTWTPRTGWTFDAATQWLDSGIVPGNGWTFMARFTNDGGVNRVPMGCRSATAGGSGVVFWATDGDAAFRAYDYGTRQNEGPAVTSGIMAMAGPQPYLNGVAEPNPILGTTATTHTLYLGANNNNGTAAAFLAGNLYAVAIWSRALSAAEVYLAYRQMAYCGVNPDWSAWGVRRRWFVPLLGFHESLTFGRTHAATGAGLATALASASAGRTHTVVESAAGGTNVAVPARWPVYGRFRR